MRYFNDLLEIEVKHITEDVKVLIEDNNGKTDEATNYLYFMRDEINKLIKQTKKAQK